ncbi:hypothetical protein CLOM_g18266 [Closterium sp. NIES-68]|nr:hypothetical protein CLOM_g18266 [Closterium sp. NIES-68]GJP63421.1 hypothetical protein CLOP_g20504 [Closterium sp. NIES-67]
MVELADASCSEWDDDCSNHCSNALPEGSPAGNSSPEDPSAESSSAAESHSDCKSLISGALGGSAVGSAVGSAGGAEGVVSPIVPECPVCLELYDQEQRVPRLVACGHTICQACARNLPLTRDFFGKKCISCPECRCLVVWKGLASMPKNFALLRLIADAKDCPREKRAATQAMEVCRTRLGSKQMVFQIADLLSVVSVLFGILLGMCVFVPLCCVYLALGWSIAALTFLAFSILSTAAVGFAAAGLFSLLSYKTLKFLNVCS